MFDCVTSTLFDNVPTPPIPGNRSNTVNSRWSHRNGSFVSSLPSVTGPMGRVSFMVRENEKKRETVGKESVCACLCAQQDHFLCLCSKGFYPHNAG